MSDISGSGGAPIEGKQKSKEWGNSPLAGERDLVNSPNYTSTISYSS